MAKSALCALGALVALYAGGVDVGTLRSTANSVTYTDRNGSVLGTILGADALHTVGVPLAGGSGPIWARALGFIALVFASINIFGGFLVTQRMLAMYQKKKK